MVISHPDHFIHWERNHDACCTYYSVVRKLFTLQGIEHYFTLHFTKYSPHQMKAVELSEVSSYFIECDLNSV
jgi:hypothetical protein